MTEAAPEDITLINPQEEEEVKGEQLSREAVSSIFQEFDVDQSGTIDTQELQLVAHALGETLDDASLEEAMAALDTDGNGTIDFEEFYAWISAPRDAADNDSKKEWKMRVLQSKLTARYYRKVVQNGAARLKARMAGSDVAAGESNIALDLQVGEQAEGQGMSLQFSQLSAEEAAADGDCIQLFLTLREGADPELVDTALAFLTQASQMVPVPAMNEDLGLPLLGEYGFEVVDYEGGKALRLKIELGINPFEMAEQAAGLNPLHMQLTSVKLSLGARLEQLFSGEATLAQLLQARFQADLTITKSMKAVLRELARDKLYSNLRRAGKRRAAIAAIGFYLSLKQVCLTIHYEDLLSAALDMLKMSKDEGDEKLVEFVQKLTNTSLAGLNDIKSSAVQLGQTQLGALAEQGAPPIIGEALVTYPAFTVFKGFGALRITAGGGGYTLSGEGLNPLLLLPTQAAVDGAAPLPSSAEEAEAVLSDDLLELAAMAQELL